LMKYSYCLIESIQILSTEGLAHTISNSKLNRQSTHIYLHIPAHTIV